MLFLFRTPSLAEVCFDLFYEVALWLGAHELVYHLAVLDEQNGRNRGDAVVHAHLGVLVHINLSYINLTSIFF